MATVTRIGAYGGPRQRYNSFAGKEVPSGVGPETHTRVGAHGGPRQLYGSFAGKSAATGVGSETHTRMGASGGPRQRYGSFAGKLTLVPRTGGGDSGALAKSRMRAAMLQHEEREMASLAMIVVEAINEIS